MAKASGRKLKVFQAQFGFYDTVVAAPSQAAALRAWGIHQDLFASGQAKVTTDEAAIAAATAHPEAPLRRAVGSNEPFALEPTSLPSVPDLPKRKSTNPLAKRKPATPPKPAVDRSGLDAAEKALHEIDDRRKNEEADFRREADDLDARRQAAQGAYVEARKAASAKVLSERSGYRRAGGED